MNPCNAGIQPLVERAMAVLKEAGVMITPVSGTVGKTLESQLSLQCGGVKGLTFNKADPAPFQAALKSSGFYKQAQQQFGPEAWALLTKYTGP